tara:strand:- start:90 stop:341 length:252 start_codon:yes stop_codon:yes gene_type:complete
MTSLLYYEVDLIIVVTRGGIIMPIVRVKDDGSKPSEGKIVAAVGVVGAATSVVLYLAGLPDLAIYTCVLLGTLCTAYNSYAKV